MYRGFFVGFLSYHNYRGSSAGEDIEVYGFLVGPGASDCFRRFYMGTDRKWL